MDLRYDGDDSSTLDLVVSDCPETVPNDGGIYLSYFNGILMIHP